MFIPVPGSRGQKALDPGSWSATLTKKKPVMRIRMDLELNSKSDHDQDDLKMSDQQSIITASQHPCTKNMFLPVRANVVGPHRRSWPWRRGGVRRSGQSWPGRRRSAGSPPAPWPGVAPLRYSLRASAIKCARNFADPWCLSRIGIFLYPGSRN